MSGPNRDNQGRFSEKMRDQDILKAFDFEATVDEPYLTVSEVQDALAEHWDIEVTNQGVRTRLEQMRDDGTIRRCDLGTAVMYRALVGPRLDRETAAQVDREIDRSEYIPHGELR